MSSLIPKAASSHPGTDAQEAWDDLKIASELQRLENVRLGMVLKTVEDEALLLRTLVDQLPDLLFMKDRQSRFLVVNRATVLDFGRLSAAEFIGKTDFDFYPAAVAQKHIDHEQAIMSSGNASISIEELSFNDKAGEKWFSVTKLPFRDADGEIAGLVCKCHDLTERKKAEGLRIGQAHILEMVAAGAPLERVLEQLVHLVESQVRGILCSILLLDAEGLHLRHGAAPNLPDAYSRAIDGARIGPNVGSCGTAAYRREPVIVSDIVNDPLWEEYRDLAATYGFRSCWSTPILWHRGSVLGTFAMYSTDVREPGASEIRLVELATRIAGIAIERTQSEERIQFLAHHDALTGLPNRTLLLDRLTQAILAARRHDHWVTVVFIDLDNFKLVNDSLGHSAGDALLKIVAQRMTDCLRAEDTVVRLGGDEFILLLAELPKDSDLVIQLIQKLRAAISMPIQLGASAIQVTCSMGIATHPQDGSSADQLLANADAAMYRAKDAGGDNFQLYFAEIHKDVHDKLTLLEELRLAVERSEFVLTYQPQMDLRSGRVFAVEALVRWQHPVRGEVPPDLFIPLAEDSGLILEIGRWVLREACRQTRAWQVSGLPEVSVSVNVSARQFKQSDLLAYVREALDESGLAPDYLELELTESMLMHDLDQAVRVMQELTTLGVKLSIDDFGTGYSSLSVLKGFPVGRLKIDRSFVRDLPNDPNDVAIATAVIAMAHSLNLRVLAEGVETKEQMAFLRDSACDEIQGFLVSEPLSAEQLGRLLASPSDGLYPGDNGSADAGTVGRPSAGSRHPQ